MKKQQELHQQICDLHLHTQGEKEYGVAYREHFLEQYKIAIQGIDYTSKWKHFVNNYFLTIHTVLLAAIGLSVARDQIMAPVLTHQIVPIIGVFMATAWWVMVRSSNDVLSAKFAILHCIEKHLPLAIYKTEWEILGAFSSAARRIAVIEAIVPFFFLVFYGLILIFL